jgi:hypothetical protein
MKNENPYCEKASAFSIVLISMRKAIGLLSSPNQREEVIKSQKWLYSFLAKGVNRVSSDICDYEVRRRTLLTLDSQLKKKIIDKLDNLQN